MDTVLVGGVGMLLLIAAVWQGQKMLDKSALPERLKRLGNYALILIVIIAAISAMRWHSNMWLAGTVQ